MPFFFRFVEKNQLLKCPYCDKNVNFLKKHTALMPILSNKRQLSQKHSALISFYSIFSCKTSILSKIQCYHAIFIKNPYYYAHIQSKKRQIYNRICFFRFFTKKSLFSCPYFVKKRLFSKKHNALMPTHCQKNAHSLKYLVLSWQIFHIFHENLTVSCPYLAK